MKPLLIVLCVGALLGTVTACSSTPGDAALRAGRSDAAARLYQRGAEQGDGSAALKLGLLLMRAELPNYGQPGRWFMRGCELGKVVACHNAGVGYEYSQYGLAKNYEEARRFYTVAAEKGYMPSEYNLGSLYANSYFNDDIEGLMWLLVSQRHARKCLPDPGCKWTLEDEPGHVAKLKRRMNPSQISEAETRAESRTSRE